LDTQPEANETVNPPQPNPANPGNPANSGDPSPAGNIPGQPPRFRPNGEPLNIPDPDPDPPRVTK
jgi:hypothetical protein